MHQFVIRRFALLYPARKKVGVDFNAETCLTPGSPSVFGNSKIPGKPCSGVS